MKKLKYSVKLFLAIIAFGVSIVSVENNLFKMSEQLQYSKMKITDDVFRSEFYTVKQLDSRSVLSEECKRILTNVEKEAIYYPVAESSVDKSLRTSFVNSWMSERTFGGKRGHEGVDIMASIDKSGLFPIVSMTDGVVTNLGWLEKGGYRIGITSDSGIYYYYAHLDSYANIKQGQRVKAGELLGYMGNTGYGPEGTYGKFAVHLHVGIYLYQNEEEVSFNPYYLLRCLEKNKFKYAYS